MRKRIGGMILFISLILLILVLFLPGSRSFNECIVAEDAFESLKMGRVRNDDSSATLWFNEQKLMMTTAERTFFYSLIDDSQSAFNPKVRIGGKANCKLAVCEHEIDEDLIAGNEKVELMLYTDKEYSIFHLVCTTLPLMEITSSQSIGEEDCRMQMTLFDNRSDAVNRVVESSGRIRTRGSSSLLYDKKSYKLTLDQESLGNNRRKNVISLLGMKQTNGWILYSGYSDQEKIRNVFSQNLWKRSCAKNNQWGIDTGNEYRYAEVFINGEYAGLFALGYTISEEQMGLGKGEFDDTLYKKISWYDERYMSEDPNEEILGYEIKDASDDWAKLWNYYHDLADNSNDTYRLLQEFDLDNAIDMYLFLNLIQASDHTEATNYDHVEAYESYDPYGAAPRYKNAYLLLRSRDKQIKSLWIPWDMDIAWGNGWKEDAPNFTIKYDRNADFNMLFEIGYLNQCLENNDGYVWSKLLDRYDELRTSTWSLDALNAMIDEYESDIYDSGAYLREMGTWPNGTYQDPSLKLGLFKAFVEERLTACDEYMSKLRENVEANIFIKRCLQYSDLNESVLILEMNDTSLLENAEYCAFLDYLRIDRGAFLAGAKYALGIPSEGYIYLESLGDVGEQMATGVGTIQLYRDEDIMYLYDHFYSVYLDDVHLFDTYNDEKYPIRMGIVKDGFCTMFNFSREFVFAERVN